MTESGRPNSGAKQEHEAAEHVAEAHRLLNSLKSQLDKHPDLEQAISNLELALSILATKTGGML
ncbi:MAG TPA: hypothetical protein VKB58_09395 [Terriglobales bacterium]|jgi:hypothetical protein|nr:hypothetical protein [Terriglobales bacterium]